MKFKWTHISLAVLAALIVWLQPAQAASGLPDTLEFGYGARLDINGQQITPAINAAAGMGFDWIAVEFNWASLWPDRATPPDLNPLHQAMAQAKNGEMNVVLSLTNPPEWSLGPSGPDADLAAAVVFSLWQLYPETLLAVELFPSANTQAGWGRQPDPAAYTQLLAHITQVLQQNQVPTILVAGGLTPLSPASPASDMDDLLFIDGLYKSGAAPWMPILSIRLETLTGDPMHVPGNGEHRYLRHFEEVRQVMLQNNHQQGLIWITSFYWPSGAVASSDIQYSQAAMQASWLSSAYRLMRSQLFIGAAFFGRLNPAPAGSNSLSSSLVLENGSLHPAAVEMNRISAMSGNIKTIVFQGNISKKTPLKVVFKPAGP